MNSNHKEKWSQCLTIIKDNVSESEFKTWFAPLEAVKLEGSSLWLRVPSQFIAATLDDKYADLLHKTIVRVIGPAAKLTYRITVDSGDKRGGSYNATGGTHAADGRGQNSFRSYLNPAYNFDNFIEGKCNQMPRAAGLSIAKKPGELIFNPLFIYGRSGVGKTHLANAIGLKAKELHPQLRVLYVSANLFQLQYTQAVRDNKTNEFVNYYQNIDMLIIDDIQEFGEGKRTATQHAFFHIFNHLKDSGRQLILTCDKKPADLGGLEERLLTRFKSGLSAEIEMPNFETRKSILKSKIEQDGLRIPERVVDYIAENVKSSIRDLEGTIASLLAISTMTNKTINLDLARKLIENLVSEQKHEDVTIDSIKDAVCSHYRISIDELLSNSRKREFVQARQIAMYFAKKLTDDSLTNIGQSIGRRNHATVLHACKTVEDLMETDKSFRMNIDDIESKLKPT